MQYFEPFENIQQLKNQYRKLVFELHPDYGGRKEDFQAMQNEYEKLLRDALNNFFTGKYESSEKQSNRVDWEMKCDEAMRAKLDEILHLADVLTIEIIGNWIWVTSGKDSTKTHKDELYKKGFQFSGKKVAWYWHDGKYKKKSKKRYSMNDLRATFDSAQVSNSNKKEQEEENRNAELPQ